MHGTSCFGGGNHVLPETRATLAVCAACARSKRAARSIGVLLQKPRVAQEPRAVIIGPRFVESVSGGLGPARDRRGSFCGRRQGCPSWNEPQMKTTRTFCTSRSASTARCRRWPSLLSRMRIANEWPAVDCSFLEVRVRHVALAHAWWRQIWEERKLVVGVRGWRGTAGSPDRYPREPRTIQQQLRGNCT